ncbi:DUF4362 domain-containing protein [Bacillus mobilis]|nr:MULTISPECIES: DUF4362 domain-containing protein [Bacillus cereus group]MDG1618175.1 DUF4362 domain-containing protein [Bacillus mobilis]MDX5841338.1 DUF4362 domain-containing protein [Bacillus cereus group sp. BfR-BA-01700]OJE50628.1 hypothetical protein BAQ44_22910 [Bacillus mobilis]HDR7240355.1 DUF4362 domain-containing protein [Bacillus mobilis]
MLMKKWGCLCSFLIILVACSQHNITIDKKNDVIVKAAGISNLDRFEKFVLNVEQGEVDKIRIVHYTHEGDPIFQTLEYSGTDIIHRLDNRKDRFAGNHTDIDEDSCKRIVKEQRELQTAYRLIDCVNENGRNGYDLLYVPEK